MDVYIREPLSVYQDGKSYEIRTKTKGVVNLGQVLFFDVTKTVAVAFAKDFCLETPALFQIQRTITDKDVSLRDVFKVLSDSDLPDEVKRELSLKLNSL